MSFLTDEEISAAIDEHVESREGDSILACGTIDEEYEIICFVHTIELMISERVYAVPTKKGMEYIQNKESKDGDS